VNIVIRLFAAPPTPWCCCFQRLLLHNLAYLAALCLTTGPSVHNAQAARREQHQWKQHFEYLARMYGGFPQAEAKANSVNPRAAPQSEL